jgi:hypothetical protein
VWLHERIRTREKQARVPVVETNQIRRFAVRATDLDDLDRLGVVTDVAAAHQELVTDMSMHKCLPGTR